MNFRRTKIVATIGPASQDEEVLDALIKAGVNVARLNFSHGTHATHQELYDRLRRLSVQNNVFLSILQDLCGPKIRVGEVQEGSVLKEGEECVFTDREVLGNSHLLSVSYPNLAQEVEPGHTILLDDGALQCQVEYVKDDKIYTRVLVGGPISSHKGVNLPGTKLSVPSLTEKDADDLRFGLKMGVDYVAMSFVRSPHDVEAAHKIMHEVGIFRPIIAKIEKPEAIECIEEIVEAFDGIMVARGDLGVEMPLDQIPVIQKRVISLARSKYKPVICATQMLDSMIRNPRPTRAEVTDVANAILDGVDAVMLSGETAAGHYPVEAVEVMAQIAERTEISLPCSSVFSPQEIQSARTALPHELGRSACEIAEVAGAKAILACTATGQTARNISHFRPSTLIVGVAHSLVVARQLNLLFGVEPAYIEKVETVNELVFQATQEAHRCQYVSSGDKVVAVSGFPPGCETNFIFVNTTP